MKLLKRSNIEIDDFVTTLVYQVEGHDRRGFCYDGHELEVSINGAAVHVRLVKFTTDGYGKELRSKVSEEMHTFEEFLQRVAPLIVTKMEMQDEQTKEQENMKRWMEEDGEDTSHLDEDIPPERWGEETNDGND
jgi:hypothetical protein